MDAERDAVLAALSNGHPHPPTKEEVVPVEATAALPGSPVPNGPLSGAGDSLVAAVGRISDTLDVLEARLGGAGVLRQLETPPEPATIGIAPGDAGASPLAEMIGLQASRLRVVASRIEDLTERVDR